MVEARLRYQQEELKKEVQFLRDTIEELNRRPARVEELTLERQNNELRERLEKVTADLVETQLYCTEQNVECFNLHRQLTNITTEYELNANDAAEAITTHQEQLEDLQNEIFQLKDSVERGSIG